MFEHPGDPNSKRTPAQRRLLWTGSAIVAILLFVIVFRLVQTRTKKMVQPPQSTGNTLAVITNSGSTNAPGSRLEILKDGSASLTYQKGTNEARFQRYQNKTFPAGTFASSQLENILTQIQDVGTIPNHDCLKSVSFGSTTTITYKGKTSGDLSCLSNADPKLFLDLKDMVMQNIYPRVSRG